jgi:hypothetical protein
VLIIAWQTTHKMATHNRSRERIFMLKEFRKLSCAVAVSTILLITARAMARERWTADRAETWYASRPEFRYNHRSGFWR